jgi:hypothetical protein
VFAILSPTFETGQAEAVVDEAVVDWARARDPSMRVIKIKFIIDIKDTIFRGCCRYYERSRK